MKTNLNHQPIANRQPAAAPGSVALCRKAVALIETAKAAILSEYQPGLEDSQHLLRLAVNEAEALAWETDFPHLVFPTLAAEKAQAIGHWQSHQQSVQRAHATLAFAA